MSHATGAAPAKTRSPAARWPVWQGNRFTGCLRQFQREPLTVYRSAWARHGDYVQLRLLPGVHFYMLTHPHAIEHVLSANHKNYCKLESLVRSIGLMIGNGIFTSEGEFWRKQRRLMQPAFLKNQVPRYSQHMTSAVDGLIDRWQRGEDGRTIDALPEMMTLALRIASTALFGTDISQDADDVGSAYREAFEYVGLKMNGRIWSPLWAPTARNCRFRHSKALLDRVVLDIIAQRRDQAPQEDVLGLLLAAQDEESCAGMSDQQLKDEVLTMLTAGHETTGAALAWALYLLADHPEVQQSLYEQARARLSGNTPSADDMPSIPLATAVFEETMRLYPPAWGIPPQTIEADEINGYPLPRKAILVLLHAIVHRHPDFWPQPDKFDPQRFLSPAGGRPKFAYFPFGGGPRICIGNYFAMLEGPLALAALVQRFHFTLVPNQQIVPDPTFTLRPKFGVQLVVKKEIVSWVPLLACPAVDSLNRFALLDEPAVAPGRC